MLKTGIKSWDKNNCPCKVCKVFVENLQALSSVLLLKIKLLKPNVHSMHGQTHSKKLVALATTILKCITW